MKYASLILGCSLLLAGCGESKSPADASSDVDQAELKKISFKIPGMT